MKFLSKNANSLILTEGLKYTANNNSRNQKIKQYLINEQSNFCAYTEKYIEGLDSSEVEHLNSSIKYKDDYYNYYAVIRSANLYKKDEKYRNASFFQSLFFQSNEKFESRIKYENGIYISINDDIESKQFIDFLGFNEQKLYNQRKKHIKRLRDCFQNLNNAEQIEYFIKYPQELSFITALEIELKLDLTHLIKK